MKVDEVEFYKIILDNISSGVYVLDQDGNFIFVNSNYAKTLDMSKAELLSFNTHDFTKAGHVNFSASDVAIREKRTVSLFQDVYNTRDYARTPFRQLSMVTPIFNEKGEIQNVIGTVKKLEQIDREYSEASRRVPSTFAFNFNSTLYESEPIGESPAMRIVFNEAKMVADIDAAVLVSGESGTGKEVVARFIHNAGNRKKHKMITINCASLPENLLEAELFGYEKGAFTGASPTGKVGLFEIADKGTLFLDEINSLPLNLQAKLLRAIETKTIQRIGSTKMINVDFRLITATNENLADLVDKKLFRADLFYRLNVIPIPIPPLRERQEDIIPLANYFLNYYCEKYSKQKTFSSQMIRYIREYTWPGNVRELKNLVERSVVMSAGHIMDIPNITGPTPHTEQSASLSQYGYPSLPAAKSCEDPWAERVDRLFSNGVTLDEYLEQCENEYLRLALKKSKSSYEAAKLLGTSQTSIIRKKKKHHL